MADNRGNYRENIKPGLKVGIVLKKDYKSGNTVEGIVKDILTNSRYHPHGIKVRLTDGRIGRVKKIFDPVQNFPEDKNQSLSEMTNLDKGKGAGQRPNLSQNKQVQSTKENQEISTDKKRQIISGGNKRYQSIEGKLNPYREPVQETIVIKENETGYSYKNLFYPYIKDASKIVIRDAYIIKDYQIKNLVAFCSILPERKPDEQRIKVTLITGLEEIAVNKGKQIEKLEELKKALDGLNIDFKYEFDNKLHDRSIETDSGWRIVPGRGLDIYQDPGTYYSPVTFDQTKRKCKETDIDFIKNV